MEMGSFQFEYPLAVQGRAKKFLMSLVRGDICPKGLVGCRVMRENSNIQRFFYTTLYLLAKVGAKNPHWNSPTEIASNGS